MPNPIDRNDNNATCRLILDEMQRSLDQTFSASDSLDQKANLIIAAIALILTIFAPALATLSKQGLAAITLAIICVGLSAFAIRSREYRSPLAADWNELDQHLLGQSEGEALSVLISGYVDQINHNEELNRRKARFLDFALISLILLPMLIFLFYSS